MLFGLKSCKEEEAKENYKIRSLTNFTPRKMLLEWSNQRKQAGWGFVLTGLGFKLRHQDRKSWKAFVPPNNSKDIATSRPQGGETWGRDHWRDPGVDWRIILKRIFRKWDVGVWTGLSWLRTGTGGRYLWMRWWTYGFHNFMRGISWHCSNLLVLKKDSAPLSKKVRPRQLSFKSLSVTIRHYKLLGTDSPNKLPNYQCNG
jgi:hypothetical protein